MEQYKGRKFFTYFASREVSRSTLVPLLIGASKKLREKGIVRDRYGSISLRTISGMLITAGGSRLDSIGIEDIVEVRDYDPARNSVIAIGIKEPSSETPMHFLIYRGFQSVNAVIHLHDYSVLDREDLVSTEREFPYGTIELAMEVIKALKRSNYVLIKGHGSVCMGKSLDETLDKVFEMHERRESDEG